MPEQLLGRIIRVSSNPGEVVLDPFGGSGTTLTVAKKLGRRWLGFELSPEYVRRIQTRLAGAQPGDPLDGPEDPLGSAPTTKSSRATRLSKQKNAAETRKSIAAAYKRVAADYSVDQLLADPDRNRLFIAECERRKLQGSATYFNRQLLIARKTGALHKQTGKPRRRDIGNLDTFSFAGEIAMQRLRMEYEKTLDELLCNPETAEALDRIAESFAPGFTPYQYRWAALTIRKRAKQAKKWANDEFADWLTDELPRALPFPKCIASMPSKPGVYVLSRRRQALYVGETADLRTRLQFHREHLEPWEILEPTSLKWIECERHRAGLQAALIQRLRPLLNYNLLNPAGKRAKRAAVLQGK